MCAGGVAVVAFTALAISGCSLVEERRIQVPHDPPHEGAPLSWDAEATDVWSWDVELHGRGPDGVTLTRCELEQGSRRAPLSAYGSRFTAAAQLAPGDNVLAAWCEDASGARHRAPPLHLTARLRDAPVARILHTGAGPRSVLLDGTPSETSMRDRTPLASYSWLDANGTVLGRERRLTIALDAPAHATGRVRLVVRDAKGRTDETSVVVGPRGVESRARWVDDAVVYGVVPPRYGAPPLRAATRALPSIADLGATAVWLTPVFATPPGNFGYAVNDYGRVREDYGSEEDLKSLVAEAHRLGLRVLLDWVPNHTSTEHAWFREAERLGPASRTFGFYARDERGAPTHYFDWTDLPNLDYGAPEVQRAMTEQAADWLRRTQVDGFRLDAAWGVKQRTPAFYDRFTTEIRRIDPEAMLLAEASARDPYYLAHGFDATYDWTDELGKHAWEHVFDEPADAPERLEAALVASARGGDARRVLRFLDNNDTGARFVTRHGVAQTKVAAAALLTLPGVPCLFTGDEVGAEYEPYGATGVVSDADPHALRPWYQKLLALRRERPSLRSANWRRVAVTNVEKAPARGTFAAWRTDVASQESTLIVLHFDDHEATVSLPVPRSKMRDLVSGRDHAAANGVLRLKLPPASALVLASTDESIARAD